MRALAVVQSMMGRAAALVGKEGIVRGLWAIPGAALRRVGDSVARRAVVAAGTTAAAIVLFFVLAAVFLDGPGRRPAPPVEVALPANWSAEEPSTPEPVAETKGEGGLTVAAVDAKAYLGIARAPAAGALAPAPDPALIERQGELRLPRVGVDGRLPWQTYARPFDRRDDRPRLSIVVLGFGLSATASQAALDHLPADVSFALDPYAAEPKRWLVAARAAGHEVFALLPLQPTDTTVVDAGPRALIPAAAGAESLTRLDAILSTCGGCVGILALGGQGIADFEPLVPAVRAVHRRGLMVLDATFAGRHPLVQIADRIGLPRAFVDAAIDDQPAAAAIDAKLRRLEEIALKTGLAIGIATPVPLTLRRLALWAETLEARNLVLAPATAAVGSQLVTGATQ